MPKKNACVTVVRRQAFKYIELSPAKALIGPGLSRCVSVDLPSDEELGGQGARFQTSTAMATKLQDVNVRAHLKPGMQEQTTQ